MKCGHTEEQVSAYIAAKEGFDMAAIQNFRTSYDEMFLCPFPYLERVASSFRLPLADIMNILPAGEENTIGAGVSGQNSSNQPSQDS